MRLPFIILAPVCVSLGVSTAYASGVHLEWGIVAFITLGAISAHISVNSFNEYFDFKSGLDATTLRTPFSGGSGTLPANPTAAATALITALVSFVLCGLIGIYFVFFRGIGLLPLGLLGMLIIFLYTPWIVKRPLLCLFAPGAGFGPLMVLGTHFVITGKYDLSAFLASLIPFFLVSDLLLLNQFPDVDADKAIGRKNIPIVLGKRAAVTIYGLFLMASYLVIVGGAVTGPMPKGSLLGLLTFPLALASFRSAFRFSNDMQRLIPAMGQNVIINLATPTLISIGIFLS
jgi:1,4-dihydroxy-2-naphthoate octaprenyltransferase